MSIQADSLDNIRKLHQQTINTKALEELEAPTPARGLALDKLGMTFGLERHYTLGFIPEHDIFLRERITRKIRGFKPDPARAEFTIGRFKMSASRWPWQGYGWFPHKNGKGPKAVFNFYGSRFGGGWNYKFGFALSGGTLMIDLLFGIIQISYHKD